MFEGGSNVKQKHQRLGDGVEGKPEEESAKGDLKGNHLEVESETMLRRCGNFVEKLGGE